MSHVTIPDSCTHIHTCMTMNIHTLNKSQYLIGFTEKSLGADVRETNINSPQTHCNLGQHLCCRRGENPKTRKEGKEENKISKISGLSGSNEEDRSMDLGESSEDGGDIRKSKSRIETNQLRDNERK